MKPTLCLLAYSALTFAAQQATPDLTQAMKMVRDHVERLETSVPNFICKEQIISRMYQDTKVKKETHAQSILTTTRTTTNGHGTFAESRAEMSINGKPTHRNEIAGPFVWKGGPAYGDLHYLFNSDHGIECRDYKLEGPVKLEEKATLFIQTHTIPGERDACHDLPADSADKIWLDPDTLNVIRIESFNPPTTGDPLREEGATLTLLVDYAPVVFDGAEYWLPSHFISRLDFPSTPRHFVYEAIFSDYHKFGAESVIHIDAQQ